MQAHPAPQAHPSPPGLATLAGLLLACSPAKPEADRRPPVESSVAPTDVAPIRVARSCGAAESCGPDGEDGACCESRWVPGGAFPRGFSFAELGALAPHDIPLDDREAAAEVTGFFLDRFEIDRARFAAFAEEYAGPPPDGSGAHPRVDGSGWQAQWNVQMPANAEALLAQAACDGGEGAPDAGALAALPDAAPMGCLSWFVAFAFCAWDGGRLPSEIEWEYAAAGGAENRSFPWGDEAALGRDVAAPSAVGSAPALRGRFGHDDLVGGVEEWTLDWFSERFFLDRSEPCRDCANLTPSNGRVVRGADDTTCCIEPFESRQHSAARNLRAPGVSDPRLGARCARDAAPLSPEP